VVSRTGNRHHNDHPTRILLSALVCLLSRVFVVGKLASHRCGERCEIDLALGARSIVIHSHVRSAL
jgi:hypothetical protein